MIFGSDRDQLRQLYLDVWKRHREGRTSEPLERLVERVILEHPEYHALLDEPDVLARDYLPDMGQANPFLHMGMHVAIHEQLAADRPRGIRGLYQALLHRFDGAHALEHAMMECLGKCLWEAQRAGREPDELHYMTCVQRLLPSGTVKT